MTRGWKTWGDVVHGRSDWVVLVVAAVIAAAAAVVVVVVVMGCAVRGRGGGGLGTLTPPADQPSLSPFVKIILLAPCCVRASDCMSERAS